MKNEKIPVGDLADVGIGLLVSRLIRARMRSLSRKLEKLDQEVDYYEALDLATEINLLDKALMAVNEIIEYNFHEFQNDLAYGIEKK